MKLKMIYFTLKKINKLKEVIRINNLNIEVW